MIPLHLAERVLWGIAALGLAAAIVGGRAAQVTATLVTPVIWSAPADETPIAPESLATFARSVTSSDPFRLDRAPAAVAYQPGGGTPVAPPPLAPSRPALTLSGLIGGRPWAAILDGVPGHDGSVLVHAGEVVDDLTITRIDRRGVLIVGMDTTWMLKLTEPWH